MRESRDSDRFLVNTQVQSHALLRRGFGTSVPFITYVLSSSWGLCIGLSSVVGRVLSGFKVGEHSVSSNREALLIVSLHGNESILCT